MQESFFWPVFWQDVRYVLSKRSDLSQNRKRRAQKKSNRTGNRFSKGLSGEKPGRPFFAGIPRRRFYLLSEQICSSNQSISSRKQSSGCLSYLFLCFFSERYNIINSRNGKQPKFLVYRNTEASLMKEKAVVKRRLNRS